MIKNNDVTYFLEDRKNIHTKSGREWAFNIKFGKDNWWTITTWDSKPNDIQLERVKEIIFRSFEIYHRQLSIPCFDITIRDKNF